MTVNGHMASSLGVFNACREGAVETDLCRRSKIKDGDMDHVEAFLRIECSKVSPRFARTFLIADQHHDNRHLLLLESVQRRPLRIKISKRHRAAKNTTRKPNGSSVSEMASHPVIPARSSS